MHQDMYDELGIAEPDEVLHAMMSQQDPQMVLDCMLKIVYNRSYRVYLPDSPRVILCKFLGDTFSDPEYYSGPPDDCMLTLKQYDPSNQEEFLFDLWIVFVAMETHPVTEMDMNIEDLCRLVLNPPHVSFCIDTDYLKQLKLTDLKKEIKKLLSNPDLR